MSKFLYGSFSSTKNAINYLIEHINSNGGEASKSTTSSAMIDIVKWNNIENTTLTLFGGDVYNVTLFVRDEIDNEAVFCFNTGQYNFSSSVYFVYYIHLSNGSIINEGKSTSYGVHSYLPIIESIFTKKEKFNISKMLSCRKQSNTTMISIADRDLYTADALIDTGVIYTDALGNKFIGAAPFILCKYDE